MASAPQKKNLSIAGPAGALEALLEHPADFNGQCVGIICHPHPLHQGTMLNKVVHTLARAMNDAGAAALRFNFRGVGKSAGAYADGVGEMEDLLAVAEFARGRWPAAKFWLGGFSFGAVVSARAAAEVQPARLISIAPAVNILGREMTETPKMPWLIVQGDADDVVPAQEVIDWCRDANPNPDLIVLPGVGHFFHGSLVTLRELLVEWLDTAAG